MKFFGLLFFWFLLSGKLDAFHALLGITSVLIVLQTGTRKTSYPLSTIGHYLLRGLGYTSWLLGRIILAALHVSQVILQPKMAIAPKLIRHKSSLAGDNARVVFANSITLTPGTITVEIEDGELAVHQLDDDSSGDIVSGLMETQISKIFKTKVKRK